MNTEAYRHGEICFVKVDSIPEGLEPTKTNIFAKGKTGNSHTFKGGEIYLQNEGMYIIGYLKAKNTKLYHSEHSPEGAKIPDGNYQLRRQVEHTPEGLKPVID